MTVFAAAVAIFIKTGRTPKESARFAYEIRNEVLDLKEKEEMELDDATAEGMKILSTNLGGDDDEFDLNDFDEHGNPRHE